MADKSYKSTLFKRAIDLGRITVGIDTDLIKVWRTSTGEEKAISLGDIVTGLIGDYVPYTGAVDDVNLGEYGLSTGYVKFDTTPTNTPALQGTLAWADNRSTLSLLMNGTLQYVGQSLYLYAKNSTGSSIPKGTNVGFAGTDGASGHVLISKFLANGSSPSTYYIGVTSETIGNGAFGQVMVFGELSGFNTSSYSAGALLYASTTVAGGFQTTVPQAPNNIILVCATINSKNNGDIIVRPTIGSNINNDEGVKITSPTTGDLLQLQSNGLWENRSLAQVIGTAYVPSTRTITINGTAFDLSANRSWSVGTVTSVGVSVPTGLTVSNTPITSTGTIAISLQTGYSIPTTAKQTEWDLAYTNRITSLTTTGSSGAATLISNVLNIPNYTLAGLGGVPTTRTLTINGTAFDLSANRSWSVGTVTSITGGTGLSGGTITGSGTLSFDTSWGDARYSRLIDVINSSNTWSHVSLQNGIDFQGYTTGSSGFPSTLGFAVAFYASTSDSTSGFGRAFALNREYNTENYYLGSPNTSGVSNPWRLIYHAGNLTLSTLGGVPTTRTLTINGTAFDLSANRSWTVGTIGGSIASGQVAFGNGTNTVSGSNNFYWDSATNRLSIGRGAETPSNQLQIIFTQNAQGGVETTLAAFGNKNSWSTNDASMVRVGFSDLASIYNGTDWDFYVKTGSSGAPTEKFRIKGNGNVLVGTTTDNGAKVQINGGATLVGNVILDSGANRTVGLGTGTSNPRITFGSAGSIVVNVASGNNINFERAGGNFVTFTGAGIRTYAGGIQTTDPYLGTADVWELGTAATTGTSTPDRWIRVQIGGEYYDILAVHRGTVPT